LGLIKLNELGVDVAGENIGFKGIMFNKKSWHLTSELYSFHVVGVGGLFFPSSPEMVVNRPQPPSTSEKCPVHNISMDYWCYADEVMLCSSCRIYLVTTLVMTLSKFKTEIKKNWTVYTERLMKR
jgi:hypothetical protein